MKIYLLAITTLLFFNISPGFSQCSDAGICSIGHYRDGISNEKVNQVGINYIFGYSTPDDEVAFHTLRFDGSLKIFNRTFANLMLPVLAVQSGPQGTVSGVGDMILSIRHELFQIGEFSRFGFSTGMKLATGNANKNDNLPQIYQPGLGTNDLLLGIHYNYRSFGFLIGYQWVENRRNKNAVTRLKRGDDLMAQLSYMHSFNTLSVTGKILAIKRLQESSVLDSGSDPQQYYLVSGSDQLQINLDASILYKINKSYGLKGQFVSALLSRDVNVDGLTRGITIAFGGIYFF